MYTSLKVVYGIVAAGVIGVIPVSYVIYDKNNPKGYSFLVKDGYTFNNPQFAGYDKIGQGCYKNLFKDLDDDIFDSNKAYGCAIMSMNKYEGNGKLSFNSEISIRKGNKGWILNTGIVSTDKSYLTYIITELEKKNNKWEYILEKHYDDKNLYVFAYKIEDNNKIEIRTPDKEWFNNTLNSSNHTESKEYKGIWISDDMGTDNWILEKIETSIENEKLWSHKYQYNVEASMIESINKRILKIVTVPNKDIQKGFSNVDKDKQYWGSNASPHSKWINLFDEIKDIKGTWMDLEKICSLSDKRNPDKEEMNKLKMFCANKGSDSDLLRD